MKQFDVEKSPLAIGKKKLLSYLKGGKLTAKASIEAKCYECMCGYADGKRSCKITDCPLYPRMPYKEKDAA
jgi:hypothetical protein